MMLNVANLVKSYGSRVLFDHISFLMGPGERLGLVGRNGHGKSTLFKLILGEEAYDSGIISTPKNYRIGHLAQHIHFTENTLIKEACLGLQAEEKDHQYKAEAILFGLGFTKDDLYRAPQEFSGGYQIRLNLAKILVNQPDLLLLDEQTNYLDIVSIRWLTKFLRQWKGELVLITHDRTFMDQVTTHTAMIHRTKVKKIQGGTQKVFDQIKMEEEIFEKTRVNDDKKRKEVEEFVDRFRAKASKASMVQSRVKLLESMPKHEKLANVASLGFEFNHAETQAKVLLKAENISFSYVSENTLINNFTLQIKHGEKIAIIGKNGKGKSTLMNLLAENLTPNQGTIQGHNSLKSGVFGQTNISILNPKLTIEEEIASENPELSKTAIRSICACMMFPQDDAMKKISVLSGGEKSRVLLGKILAKKTNILFLDEPTNHLDMESIDALTQSLQDFPGSVVVVTHSEALLKALPTKFIVFQANRQDVFEGSYDEFLTKVGWEEEVATKPANVSKRREFSKENSKAINQIKKNIENFENAITIAEEKIKKLNLEMISIIENNKHQEVGKIAAEIKKTEMEIESLFVQYHDEVKKLES